MLRANMIVSLWVSECFSSTDGLRQSETGCFCWDLHTHTHTHLSQSVYTCASVFVCVSLREAPAVKIMETLKSPTLHSAEIKAFTASKSLLIQQKRISECKQTTGSTTIKHTLYPQEAFTWFILKAVEVYTLACV